MYHVLAYQGSSHDVVGLDATPVQDDIFSIQNGHFLPQNDLLLYGLYCGGNLLQYTQLVTPTTRQISIPRMIPISSTILPPTNPNMVDMRGQPFHLRAIEEISMLNTLGTNASNLPFVNLLFVGNSLVPVPQGDIYTLHGTSTTAAVSLAWTSISITYDTTIPAGTYAIIGCQHISTNALAHRFIFKDQIYRPGFVSVTSAGNRPNWEYYRGGMGQLGTFTTVTYPTIQVLCNGTDASHDITLSIVRIA
jgi:hypothetical protein